MLGVEGARSLNIDNSSMQAGRQPPTLEEAT
jgi:hypothetical protein